MQIFQIALHYGLQVGIDHYCRSALVFAEFGEDLVRDGERNIQRFQRFATASSFLGFAKEKSSEIAMDCGLAAAICVGECGNSSVVGDGQDFSVCGGAFVDAEAEIFWDQWLDAIEEEVVEFGAGLASDFDGVFETAGGDESGARAFAFKSVLVPTVVPCRRMKFGSGGDLLDGFDDGLRGIGGSRENFQHAEAARFDPHTVGEGAAGVDGDAERLGAAGHGVDRALG